MMTRRRSLACALLAWLLPALPAAACAVPAETSVWNRPYAAIVVAVVEAASDAGAPAGLAGHPDWRPWQATARLRRLVEGRAEAITYTFDRNAPFHICAMAEPMPKPRAGEDWVLYLQRDAGSGDIIVAASYPLAFAQQFDRRLRGRR